MINNLSKILKAKNSKLAAVRGFTLAELLVSIAIMVTILTLILVNYRKFDSGVVLTNLAYDIGLSIRKAQTYGISVSNVKNTNYSNAYGISFHSATPQSFRLFVDSSGNDKKYTAAPGSNSAELVETYKIRSPYRIKDICRYSGATRTCGDLTQVDLTFMRPNPDAYIKTNPDKSVDAVEIVLGSDQDSTALKSIIVRPTGQISVQ